MSKGEESIVGASPMKNETRKLAGMMSEAPSWSIHTLARPHSSCADHDRLHAASRGSVTRLREHEAC